jgi:hypothetical protein
LNERFHCLAATKSLPQELTDGYDSGTPGLDSWMQSSARHLSRSPRILAAAAPIDNTVATILSRQFVPPPVRVHSPKVSTPAFEEPSSTESEKIPDSYQPIDGTPFAWPVMDGWVKADPDKVALYNKVMLAMFSGSRVSEFEIVSGMMTKGTDLKQLLAGAPANGFLFMRLNVGMTPADLVMFSKAGFERLRGTLDGGKSAMLSVLQATQESKDASGALTWDSNLGVGVWNYDATTPEKVRVAFRAISSDPGWNIHAVAKAFGDKIEAQLAQQINRWRPFTFHPG